jgi:hypothetical protein
MPILRVNYAFLVPWIVLTLPSAALFQQQWYIMSILVIVGLSGMLLGIRRAASATSAALIVLIIWGKVATDLFALPGPDSAYLLLEFMAVIFLMEASNTTLTMTSALTKLTGKDDDISSAARIRLTRWMSAQLASLGKLVAGGFGLALGLLLIGGFVNVAFNQLAFSGVLVLAAVVAILILLTYRREPEERKSKSQFQFSQTS